MAALADCYSQYEREGIEDEEGDSFMNVVGDNEGFYSDEENDYSRPNDGRCSPEIPLVDIPPRKLPAKSFYRSATAQLSDSSEAALPKDTTHEKSSKNRLGSMVTVSDLGVGGGRSKAALGQTPSRQRSGYKKSKDGSSSRQVQVFLVSCVCVVVCLCGGGGGLECGCVCVCMCTHMQVGE